MLFAYIDNAPNCIFDALFCFRSAKTHKQGLGCFHNLIKTSFERFDAALVGSDPMYPVCIYRLGIAGIQRCFYRVIKPHDKCDFHGGLR